MYLLHATLLRTVLVWLMYEVIPGVLYETTPKVDGNIEKATKTIPNIPAILQALAFCLWMALLICLSMVWRDRVDRSCMAFSEWVEQIMRDREYFSEVIGRIGRSVRAALDSLKFGGGKVWKDIEV
jgi:hypothetical protein